MRTLASLVERLPGHELAIHRLYGRSAEFRAICGDHEMALAALCRWQAAGVEERACEYRELAAEIETEIRDLLDREAGRGPGTG